MPPSPYHKPKQREKRTRVADEGDDPELNSQKKKPKRSRLTGNDDLSTSQGLTSVSPGQMVESQQNNDKHVPGISEWSMSSGAGGRFTSMDPIFAPDGQYIILGLDTAVHVFSIPTSRLVRALESKKRRLVTGFKLSQHNSDHLYVSTDTGNITKWDWRSGRRVRSWGTSHRIFGIDLGMDTTSNSTKDTLFMLHEHNSGQRAISLSDLETNPGSRNLGGRVILETSSRIYAFQSAAGGKVLVVCAGEKFLIGASNEQGGDNFASVDYTWREFTLPFYATSFDIRERSPSYPPSQHQPTQDLQSSKVDLVIGESRGSLLLFKDILNTLQRMEVSRGVDAKSGLISSRLHWHRNAVKSVRWSRDGNYIISGGLETVLVLWQLDTGVKHFLPHLASPICNITVSPAGDLYAVKLADNSVMVLSTTELQPVASFSGLQLPWTVETRESQSQPKSGIYRSTGRTSSFNASHPPPAVLHPVNPSVLLLAVSPQLTSPDSSPASNTALLQTFDIQGHHQISRQALARTNATVLNNGPGGAEVATPDIKLIKITRDGKWMATVDEWAPRSQDIKPLHVADIEFDEGIDCRYEIFLKFWEWNEGTRGWELVTRIDDPHHQTSLGSTHVLDLASDPRGSEFATLGDDGVVRLWTCTTKYRGGVKAGTEQEDRQLKIWKCRSTIELGGISQRVRQDNPSCGCLGFSEDGSVLAVCWKGDTGVGANPVYLVDPRTSEVHHTRDGLWDGIPRGVGFLGRDLITLSSKLVVWDTVDDKLKLGVLLPDTTPRQALGTDNPLLAINHRSNTFAVTLTTPIENKGRGVIKRKAGRCVEVRVFSTGSSAPLYEFALEDTPCAMLPDPMSGDYVIVDSAAQIRRLSLGHPTSMPQATTDIPSLATGRLDNVFGNRSLNNEPSLKKQEGMLFSKTERAKEHLHELQEERKESNKTQLSNVFDAGYTFMLPEFSILLHNMMNAFIRNNNTD